jgi:alkaline phosphatase
MKWTLPFAIFGAVLLGSASAKTRIVLFVQEGLGHELITAAHLFSEDREIWDWRFDHEWHRVSLSTLPLSNRSIPDGRSPDMPPLYSPMQAWNGSPLNQEALDAGNPVPFLGYRWLIENATDRNQAATAISSGIRSFNTAVNWMNSPVRSGSPVATGQTLVEWAKLQGLATGVISDMPFNYTTSTILAGVRSPQSDDAMGRFYQVLKEGSLNLYVAAGHPRYNEVGQALTEPKYLFCSAAEWQELRGRARTLGWDLVFGDDNLAGIHAQGNSALDRRLVILQFGDTTATDAMTTDSSGLHRNLGSTMRFQIKTAMEYLDRSSGGFLLIVHMGRLPHLLKSDLYREAVDEVISMLKSSQETFKWLDKAGDWSSSSLALLSAYEYGLLWGADSTTYPFSQITNRGKNRVPGMRINHTGPTAMLAPAMIRGAVVAELPAFMEGKDPVYGPYLHAASFSQALRMGVKKAPETP